LKKRETKQGRDARLAFYENVLDRGRCWLHNIVPHECDGPTDPCHLMSKQKLRKIALDRGYDEGQTFALLWDSRNGVPGCRAYHHKFDNGFMRIYWHQLPSQAVRFAQDWEIEWEMEQVFRKETPHE
jgi:hypothetical protein